MRYAGLILCLFATPALAEDRALLIGNETYAEASSIPGAVAVAATQEPVRRAGFRVLTGVDQTTDDLRGLMSGLMAEQIEDGRLIILLAGHFAHSPTQTWFLGTEAATPDAATVAAQGVDLQDVLTLAARAPGGAIVLLGTEDRRLPLGPGLVPGIGQNDVPQGVALVQGDAADIADFVAGPLTRRGESLAILLADTDFTATGFLAPLVAFRAADGVASPRPAPPDGDDVLWQATRVIASLEGYEAYLARYPTGRHAAEATAEITRIRAEPQRDARLAEDALGLTREARRGIQQGLGLVGFDPKGVDGVFGQGSRTAITNWQQRYGHAPTGYLTRDQIVQLSSQADRRRAELAAIEAERLAQQETQDRAYWDQTGKAGDEAGLKAYMQRYPDGLFSGLAGDRLKAIEVARATAEAAADQAAWQIAREGNAVSAYEDYLRRFPRGAFADQARARIAVLTGDTPQDDATARAQAAEIALQLSPVARTLIEGRLSSLGLQTGVVDGRFDAETRAAIRRYQGSRGVAATGFLDEQTMVGLMAGGILDLPNE
jgi:peptidoglycan hydrolase-like protein with peptidoglycan-binding domain